MFDIPARKPDEGWDTYRHRILTECQITLYKRRTADPDTSRPYSKTRKAVDLALEIHNYLSARKGPSFTGLNAQEMYETFHHGRQMYGVSLTRYNHVSRLLRDTGLARDTGRRRPGWNKARLMVIEAVTEPEFTGTASPKMTGGDIIKESLMQTAAKYLFGTVDAKVETVSYDDLYGSF